VTVGGNIKEVLIDTGIVIFDLVVVVVVAVVCTI